MVSSSSGCEAICRVGVAQVFSCGRRTSRAWCGGKRGGAEQGCMCRPVWVTRCSMQGVTQCGSVCVSVCNSPRSCGSCAGLMIASFYPPGESLQLIIVQSMGKASCSSVSVCTHSHFHTHTHTHTLILTQTHSHTHTHTHLLRCSRACSNRAGDTGRVVFSVMAVDMLPMPSSSILEIFPLTTSSAAYLHRVSFPLQRVFEIQYMVFQSEQTLDTLTCSPHMHSTLYLTHKSR